MKYNMPATAQPMSVHRNDAESIDMSQICIGFRTGKIATANINLLGETERNFKLHQKNQF
jgi:hypothetical protein